MTFRDEIAAAKAQSHWTARQRNHLRRLIRQGATICYWTSDAHGRPANHDMDPIAARDWTARPGLVQIVAGPLEPCSARSLHATLEPHRWRGVRVWIVGIFDPEKSDGKFATLRREIIGEVLPEEATDPRVGVRVGRRDLSNANLSNANPSGADLSNAYLSGAYWPKSRPAPEGWTHEPPVADREWIVLRRAL